jgi:hypothetical protein
LKTTELFAEQVLIGLLVILIVGLAFYHPLKAFYESHQGSPSLLGQVVAGGFLAQIVAGGFLLGFAYLIGIVYDRIADTLLQDLESHGRLHFAFKPLRIKGSDKFVVPHNDPFEDGKYRILVLGNSQATDHMEYLRSRIRLTRALTTLIPGIMVSLLLAADDNRAGRWWYVAAAALPVVYAATLFMKGMKCKHVQKYRPPKTYDLKKLAEYMTRGRLLREGPERPRSVRWFVFQDEVWFALFLLTVAAAKLVSSSYGRFSVVVAGVVLTIIVGWSWWRICGTFYSFLRNYQQYGTTQPPA